jgi:AraC-like DNA-binding protein
MNPQGGIVLKTDRLFKLNLVRMATRADPERVIHGVGGSLPECRASSLHCYHTHVAREYEFAQVLRGQAYVALPGGLAEVGTQDLLVINRGVKHAQLLTDPPQRCEIFWCHIRGRVALLSQTAFAQPSTFHHLQPLELTGRTDLESIAAAISRELTARDWGWKDSFRGLLHYLTSILVRRLERGSSVAVRAAESPSVDADPRTGQTVRAVMEFCETNYRRRVRLEELAAVVGYSSSHLSRLISRHLGRSFLEHLLSLRMEAAMQLLESADPPVREIAHSLGYADPAHFTRAFTKFTGLSPGSYRRRSLPP